MEKHAQLSEKAATGGLPGPATATPSASTTRSAGGKKVRRFAHWTVSAIALLLLAKQAGHHFSHRTHNHDDVTVLSEASMKCAQSPVLTPSANLTDVYDPEIKDRIINWLSGAVQVPTECFDVMGPVGEDKRWDVFEPLHAFFAKAYPNVYASMTVDKVNTYGLVYELKGSESSKKPILLTGHQDVVPVEPSTVGSWTHPPFSGHYDGTYIWGRGSLDDKAGVTGMLAALELLLERGFEPKRTVVVALGFDEEASGKVGAYYLNEFLEAKYGKDSMWLLVDEGNGISEQYGQMFAGPAVGEKGYLDVEVRALTPGGHSSVPPEHTGIGLLAQAISELEANPVPIRLTRKNPVYEAYQCFVQSPEFPKGLKDMVIKSRKSDRTLKKFAKYLAELSGSSKAGIATTRAVDLVYGGVKVNALPEVSTAVVNHRINADSSVAELQEQMTSVIAPLAEKLGVSFRSFGKDVSVVKESPVVLELNVAFNSSLEPAPISPHDVSSSAWNLLAGSAKSTWTTSPATKGQELLFAPGLAIGNTDTKRYWGLTKNIYRFGYAAFEDGAGVHTVNEHAKATTIMEGVRFFQTLILNADEADE